jgi:hypothetical protein
MSGNLTRTLCFACLSVLAGCAPRAVLAQANPDSVHHGNDCRLAAQVISTGHPAHRAEWALAKIQNCRDGGHTLAQAISARRSSSDVEALDAVTRPAIRLRDGEVFSASLEIAGDRGASPQARVFAIRTLMWAMFPGGGIEYSDLADLVQGRQRSCFGHGPSTETEITQGTPLPRDYVDRAKALARRLNEDETEVHSVRRAAVCLALVQPWSKLPD